MISRAWITLVFLAFSFGALHAEAYTQGYGVLQDGNLLIVKTPFGSNIYSAPVGFTDVHNYIFEIPLGEFRAQVAAQNGGGRAGRDAAAGSESGADAVGDSSSLIVQANRYYNKGDFNRALGFVDEVLRRDPKNIRGWIMKGSLMHVMSHPDLAQQAYEKALELDPSNKQLQHVLQSMKDAKKESL